MMHSMRDLKDGCRWVHRPAINDRCVLNVGALPDERDEVQLGSELTGVVAARYRHYKGGQYLVVGWGRDANFEDRRLVFYVSLQEGPGAKLWARDRDDFYFGHMHRAREGEWNAGAVWACTPSCVMAAERHEPRFRLMRSGEA